MAEWAVVLGPFIRSCLDTNMFNSILIRVKITIFYNCVLDIKDTSGFFNMLLLITIMPEASQKVAETAEITKTAPQTQP